MSYIGTPPSNAFTSLLKQDFSTSATTGYTLDHAVNNANDIALFINFVRQEPTAGYAASGTTLTLTSATASSDDMYCVYLGQALQTVNPANASVGISQLSATGTKDSTTFLRGDNTFASAGGANTPYFSVRENNDQNINNNSTTKLTWDNAVTESSSGVFDLSNNKFTATVAGRYLFSVRVGFYDSDNNLKRSTVYIYKNGSSVRTTDFFMADGGIRNSTVNDTWIENVSVNDYFEVYVLINTTDSGYVSVENGSNNETTFSGFKLT